MNTPLQTCEISLAARDLYEVADVSGVQLACNRGSLWITLDNETRDIVLEAGENFLGTEHRRALVYAFETSTLALRTVLQKAPAAPARRARFLSRDLARG
jgi:hypothetical protein